VSDVSASLKCVPGPVQAGNFQVNDSKFKLAIP
jgi:hypothetical protein